ncbi:pseudouridine synthase [Pendulispora albinea]|uniref:Pseudouridine synthase n=1 Tax=Pendulispora albinea TaxID=2741071 RepID=A0ABZ2M5R4_9BACT
MASRLESAPLPAPSTHARLRVLCEHAEPCGGCPIIGLSYGEQLSLKRGRVVQSVARYSALELLYTEPVIFADSITEYRTRAKLIVAPGGKIGLYAKGGGHQIVDIPNCQVLSPSLARVAALLRRIVGRDEARRGPLAPFDVIGTGALRAVDLREVRETLEGPSRVLLTLVLQRSRVADLAHLRAAAAELVSEEPLLAGVAANFHEGEAPQILGNETVVLRGATSAPDRVGDSTHLATFGSFVQAHREQAARVHRMLAAALLGGKPPGPPGGPRPRILDLYGGSGAIALSLAAAGAEVRLVESFAPAVAQAKAAAEMQQLPLEAECGDVAGTLRTLGQRGARFTAAVVNPPRRGMSPVARELLSRLDVESIAYVSCDPDTLARDLDHFTRLGFTTTHLRPLDMIPLTDEVETVAILRRSAVPRARVVYEDEEVLVVDKGPYEPTTPQGEYRGSLVVRVRKIPGAEEAVPVHRLDVGTSGLVLFVRRPELVARWSAAFASPTARKIYVVGVRGITPSKGAITRDLREDGVSHPARTRYRRLAVASGHSVLRVIPEQGRTHQIRRHLAAIGHAVLGDDRYGHAPTNRFFEERNGLDRTFMHCVRLECDHPATRLRLIIEAPLPGDLRAVLERAGGPGTLRFLDHKNALGTASSLPPPPDAHHEHGAPLDIHGVTDTGALPAVTDAVLAGDTAQLPALPIVVLPNDTGTLPAVIDPPDLPDDDDRNGGF